MNIYLKHICWYLPKKFAHTLLHYDSHKEFINWRNPKTYDEKIRWLLVNLYGHNEAKYADKYKVREYVKKCGLEDILVPIYGAWDSPEMIGLDNLPNKFVLKTNHGSGDEFYSLIEDKSDLKKLEKELEKLGDSLKTNFAKKECEYQYYKIKPQIIAEIYLDNNNSRLTDYKILCFGGKAKYILVCSERNQGRDYFDTLWNYVPFTKKEYRSKNQIKKPKDLNKMLEYAEILSQQFYFARIDFYNLEGKIFFGEITLTPAAGMNTYITDEAQEKLGALIKLPKFV